MLKKVVAGVLAVFLIGVVGLFFWARTILATETVRTALGAQLSTAVGQPVTIDSISASIYPRVTVNLGGVSIGKPARVHVETLHVGTDFRALLSRRIEHASLRLSGARIQLPLPPLAPSSAPTPVAPPSSTPAVQVVSIDEVTLTGVEIVSGGRTLRGNVDLVPRGSGVLVRKITLAADDTSIDVTGTITDLSGPSGELSIKAGLVNIDKLLAFANDFAGGAGASDAKTPASPKAPAAKSAMNMLVSIDAERATFGAMSVTKFAARAAVKGDEMTVDPLAFGLFGGQYKGKAGVTLGGDVPAFRWNAAVTGIDMAAAAAFAGSPKAITGRLSGRIDLAGRGADATAAMKTAHGTAHMEIVDGIVTNLGVVRAVVAATSMNTTSMKQAAGGSRDEPFSKISATLAIANGAASTNDFLFDSRDVALAAQGTMRLDGMATNLKGQVQLSEELSHQMNATVVHATQEKGRVTLPAVVTGSAGDFSVRIDAADLATRAIRNEVNDQTQKALKHGLGGLLHH